MESPLLLGKDSSRTVYQTPNPTPLHQELAAKFFVVSKSSRCRITQRSISHPDVYRVGRLNFNQMIDSILRVLEIDITSLDLSKENTHGIIPDGAPPIDGIVVCYDLADESSFEPVEAVLGKHLYCILV